MPVLAVGHGGGQSDILERPVAAVAIEEVRHRIVGDEDVHPTVIVEVEADHAEAVPRAAADARRLADVFEGAVALVAKQRRRLSLVFVGVTVGLIPRALFSAEKILVFGPVEVVDDDEIEPAVVVIVEPGGARSPLAGVFDPPLAR